jgi:E3 ubiquitin-protein ligase TRAF7
LFSAGADLSIRSWKLESLEQDHVAEYAHDNIISALAVAGPYLFSASLAQIKIWKIANLDCVHTITDLNHWVRALAVGDKKEKVYSGSHNTIHVWKTSEKFSLCGKLDTSYGSVYSLAVTKQYLIVGTYNQNLHVYDINTYQHIKALTGHISIVTSLAVSLSGRYLFSSSVDTTVQVREWRYYCAILNILFPVVVESGEHASYSEPQAS